MLPAPSYDPNRFRADLPGGIQKLSADLYAFLRETLQGLRQFNSEALHGALRLNQQVLTTRYIDLVHPLDSKAAVQLATGQTAFARFSHLSGMPDPGNEGRLLYRGINGQLTAEGEDVEFAGIDYTRSGAGEYGWVVYGGYAPLHDGIFAGDSPAVVGVAGHQFTHLSSLKWGTIEAGMIYLMPAFGVPGELGGSSLAELLNRLAASEADISDLKGAVQAITKSFGRFQHTSLLALSRIENRTPDEFMASTYSEFLEQTAQMVAIGRQISVDRNYVDAQTGLIRGFATAAQQHLITARSFAVDAKYWAEATQETNLSAQAHSGRSASHALVSQSFSVAAGESASKAEIALAAMATIGAPSLIENVGFDAWPDAGADPTSWEVTTLDGVTVTRVTGPNTPYALGVSDPGGAGTGVSFAIQTIDQQANDLLGTASPGWYVVEANVELTSGSFANRLISVVLRNGGTLVHELLIPLSSLEAGGVEIGDGIAGRFYRANKLIDLTGYAFNRIDFGFVFRTPTATVASVFEVDLFSIRFATQAEVATQTILTSVVDQVASMQQTVNLLVTENASQALSISNLASGFNGYNDRLVSAEGTIITLSQASASHSSQLSAITTAQSAQATRLDTVEAGYTGLVQTVSNLGVTVNSQVTTLTTHTNQLSTHADLLTSQGSAISSLTSTYNQTVPGLVSTVAGHSSQLTTLANAQGSQATSITNLQTSYGNLNSTVGSHATAISGLASSYVSLDGHVNNLSTNLGSLSGVVSGHTTTINALSSASGAQATAITNLTTRVGANEANITTAQQSINGVLAKYVVRLDVNGDVVGFELANGGGQRSFSIRADTFFIRTSAGLKQLFAVSADRIEFGTDLHISQHRIIYDNGTVMRVQGTGFGSANQFLDWFGPTMPIHACTEANGVSWLKTNGDAYFGGAISSGILKNAASTSDLSPSAFVTVGPFGSNGKPIVVVVSYSHSGTTPQAHYPMTAQGRNDWNAAVAQFGGAADAEGFVNFSKALPGVTVVVRVDRQIGNSVITGWLVLNNVMATQTMQGQRPIPGDSDGYLQYFHNVSGSATGTDSAGTAADRSFTATIVSRSGVPLPAIVSQRVSLTAVEQ